MFILLIASLLSFITFWKTLSFDFFQDDYFFLWDGLYHPFHLFINFKHPGTPLEAFLLGPILGLHPVLWGLFGILLKIIIALLTGLFLYKLTNSKLAGFLATVFFSVSYAGMSTITAFNYHITALVGIFILLSLIYLIKSVKDNRKYFGAFILFLVFGILLDPARGLPVILIIVFLLYLFPASKKISPSIVQAKKYLLLVLVILIPLLTLWYLKLSIGKGELIEVFLKGMYMHPKYMITKTKDIGNYFGTMANLFIEIIPGLQPKFPKFEAKFETTYFPITFSILGVIFLTIDLLCFYSYLRKKKEFLLIIFYFLTWTFIFYLPNWIAEPRAGMTAQHHYLFLSSIGYICIIAYLISLIRKGRLIFFLSIIFIFLNIYQVNNLLTLQYPYRSVSYIESAWRTIFNSVHKTEPKDVFLFTGDNFWTDNTITFGGGYYFLLVKKDNDINDLPQITFDENLVLDRLCHLTKRKTYFGAIVSYSQIPLSHVFAWNVLGPGNLIDITQKERSRLLSEIMLRNCKLIENRFL